MDLFTLPNELLLSEVSVTLPCREQQIRALATFLSIRGAPSRNIVLHGLEATGKTAIATSLLQRLSEPGRNSPNEDLETSGDVLRYTVVKSLECISGRHLFEHTVGSIAKVLGVQRTSVKISNLSDLVVELQRLLVRWATAHTERVKKRFVLVFDQIDQQRDAPPTLLPALARLGEIIPNLTTIFITTSPRPSFLHLHGVPHIAFPAYTKHELLTIISHTTPDQRLESPDDTKQIWARFTTAVYESLSKHLGRDIISFRAVCLRLWPRFIQPIISGDLAPTPFSRLMVANRPLFQNDAALIHNMVTSTSPSNSTYAAAPTPITQNKIPNIASLLPTHSRLLLIAAYLASYSAPRSDALIFTKVGLAKRRKKGGGTALTRRGVSKVRKISRRLLGPQAFVLERMLAIFHAIREDSSMLARAHLSSLVSGSADVHMAVATLVSLRLLARIGSATSADVLDAGMRYRVAVSWEIIRGVARSVGLEMGDYLTD